jgi:DNA-binding transcriptional LysR family regulator
MEWSDLRIFLAIAREGTLGAAARKLGQTQPTMGRRLRALEMAVGQTLFQRTADGFVLTDEGTAVVGHAERIEEEALAFQRQLAGQEQHLDGQLRISSSDWFGSHVLSPMVADFNLRHPRVTVELLTDARVYSLARREADIAFRNVPFEEPEVISRRFMTLDYGLYIRSGTKHPEVGDGTGVTLVTMDIAFGGMPDVAWLKRVLPNAHVVSRSNNRDVQARLCALGAGLAVIPIIIGDKTDGIERVSVGDQPPQRTIWVGYHRDLRRLARLRAFLDVAISPQAS